MSSPTMFLIDYLGNALWQAPLLFVTASLACVLLRRHSLQAVHRVWVTTLALQVLLPGLVMALPSASIALAHLVGLPGPAASGSVSVSFGAATVEGGMSLPWWLVCVALLVCGAAVLRAAGRLAIGLLRTARLGQSSAAADLESAVSQLWDRSRVRFRVPQAELLASTAVRTPLTLGFRRPKVLVPAGLLGSLQEDELWTLFTHECVHIQRHDFAWNLLYELLALPLAWHPVTMWTRSRLVESRECVCDAVAARASDQPKVYARCLLRLATLLLQGAPAPTIHAIGILDANALERRIMQLTKPQFPSSLPRRVAVFAVSSVLGLGACTCAWAFSTDVKASPATQTPSAATQTVPAGVMAGNSLTRVNPEYPQAAREAHLQGAVVLRAVISEEGKVEQLTVQSGDSTLSRAALDAVRQWTYKPYLLNGQPVAVETTITVNFQMNN